MQKQLGELFPTVKSLMDRKEVIRFACCLSDEPHRFLGFICSRMEEAESRKQFLIVFQQVLGPTRQELAMKHDLDPDQNIFFNDWSKAQAEGSYVKSSHFLHTNTLAILGFRFPSQPRAKVINHNFILVSGISFPIQIRPVY